MTSKTVAWSVSVNLGNNESLGLMVTDEVDGKDDARDVFAFGIGQLIGIAKGADEKTARKLRDFVARFVQEEEAKPAVRGEQAPKVKWEPKITKPEWDRAQAAKQDAAPKTTPTIEEQAKAAVAQCVKPPATAPDPAPSAPQTAEASAPSAPPTGDICAECGAPVPVNQAKLSQLFRSKTLCKGCMDKSQGGAQ